MTKLYNFLRGVSYEQTNTYSCSGCCFNGNEDAGCYIIRMAEACRMPITAPDIGCSKGILKIGDGKVIYDFDKDIITALEILQAHE